MYDLGQARVDALKESGLTVEKFNRVWRIFMAGINGFAPDRESEGA